MTKPKRLPSQEMLQALLDYDQETGKLHWRERSAHLFANPATAAQWNTKYAGKEAFTAVNKVGYCVGGIENKIYAAHRIIWKWMIGADPEQVDHINGVRTDNRFCNLRDVPHYINSRNAKQRSDNTSGVNGVAWDKSRQQYMAYLEIHGKRKNLGRFKTLEEAAEARKHAEEYYGFTKRHGTVVE